MAQLCQSVETVNSGGALTDQTGIVGEAVESVKEDGPHPRPDRPLDILDETITDVENLVGEQRQ